MGCISSFRKLVLSFKEATEEPHFEKTSFKVKKKIFATFDEVKNMACLKLSPTDQYFFSLIDKSIIYPVPNKWGKQSWTLIDMEK